MLIANSYDLRGGGLGQLNKTTLDVSLFGWQRAAVSQGWMEGFSYLPVLGMAVMAAFLIRIDLGAERTPTYRNNHAQVKS